MPETELEAALRHANHSQEQVVNYKAAGEDLFPPPKVKVLQPGTQHFEILQYLKSGKSLTGLEALRLFGTMKLASRVSELKDMGYRFNQELITTDTGKKVMRYWL
jgi:hypothetical protein